MKTLHRRRFLTGVGGAMVALPLLDSVLFTGGTASAKSSRQVYSLFFKQNCGVAQAITGEPERFWPSELGALTPDLLRTRDADRAVSELADYADQLLIVRGVNYGFHPENCGHAGCTVQTLTAARIVIPDGVGHSSVASDESIDWRIGRECNAPGVEALNLLAGRDGDHFAGPSFSGPGMPRAVQNNPLSVYMDLMGLSGLETDLAMRIAQRRASVNDLVRDEMRDLLGSAELGSADRARLTMHFEAIRDTELTMACELGGADVASMMEISEAATDNGTRVDVAKMMMNLAALVFSCDLNRSVLVQMAGKASDDTRYMVDGVLQNSFHRISHRIDGDGSEGVPIPDADLIHHGVDRIIAGIFRHLLDRLSMYTGPSGGPLLDDCIAAWTNEVASGPPHGSRNLPWVLAGSGGGFLRTGQYIDAGSATSNKLLNTILSAHGFTNADGGYFDSFGDESLERGVIDDMIA